MGGSSIGHASGHGRRRSPSAFALGTRLSSRTKMANSGKARRRTPVRQAALGEVPTPQYVACEPMRYGRRPMDQAAALEKLQEQLGYRFRDDRLLLDALTHRSFSNERPDLATRDNETMEYLGDAILDFAASALLYGHYPKAREGELTRRRADLVCEASLCAIATELELGDALRLGKGEEKSGGRNKPRLLASGLEAVIAAIYLDSNEREAITVGRALLAPYLQASAPGELDFKSRLQESLQSGGGPPPVYELAGSDGPDHDRTFHVHAVYEGRVLGRGSGGSKLRAEQLAARDALSRLDEEE